MNDKPKPSTDKSAQSQITAKIKSLSNILITVSRDPSVDQLAAALALTLALDKMDKHATAVFSGVIPPAINFLEPEKTFESNADGLRDFIISLDKEKADRLRFKVDGDIVKVLITPYRTTISESDLSFSEGEFNVELVLAIGVDKKEDLDAAIAAHGRIFHDATVATINIDTDKGSLGSINWQKPDASSFSEMAAGLVGDLDTKDKPLLDEQTATALLTGIVAATDQFRNEKTSPAVMTLAANLMAKGANQQLISSELSAATEGLAPPSSTVAEAPSNDSGANELSLNHDEIIVPDRAETTSEQPELEINLDDMVESESKRFAEQQSADALATAQAQLTEADLANQATTPTETITPVAEIHQAEAALDNVVSANNPQSVLDDLSTATTEAPQLSHGVPYVEEKIANPLNSALQPDEPSSPNLMSAAMPGPSELYHTAPPMIDAQPTTTPIKPPVPAPAPITVPTLSSDIAPAPEPSDALSTALSAAQAAETTAGQVNDAQTAAAEAASSSPVALDTTPAASNMPPLPPANFDLPLPPPPPLPLPDVGTLPPAPATESTISFPPVPAEPETMTQPDGSLFPPVNTVPDDPTQYRIPGQ